MDPRDQSPKTDLREQLSKISFLAVQTEPNNFGGVMKLAEYLKLWAEDAQKVHGSWTKSYLLQANQVVKGLKAGRPTHQGMERILKAILEADKNLALEIANSGKLAPGTEVLVFNPGDSNSRLASQESKGFLTLKEDDLPGLKDYLQEAPSHFTDIEEGLLQTAADKWDILKVYRPFHTLKSLYGYLGFPALSELSHQAENLLEPYKKNFGKPTGDEVGLLLKILDLYRLQTKLIKIGISQGRVELCQVPKLFEQTDPANEKTPVESAPKPVLESSDEAERFLRIDTQKMDGLMETLEEWITFQTRVQMMSEDSPVYAPLTGTLDRMGKLTRKLQDQLISLRMVPIQPLFARVGRVVRDLSEKTGKPVRLEMEGGNTSLDKRLVDELWEPVLHLVRNAVDHGIENNVDREANGKNAIGGLWIKAWHQEGQFVLSIRDDGKGLDLAKIEERAVALGLLEEGRNLEQAEYQAIIFKPGFSTMEKATTVSGRGIGLDVVKRRLEALKGSVEVATVPGEGCLFVLRVPLTLALLEGLLIRAGNGLYLIPLSQIQKFSLLDENPAWEESFAPERPVRINLAEWFGSSGSGSWNQVGIQLEGGRRPLIILVDEIMGKREIVLKRLNPLMANLRGVNGGAILGDGRVALVLDIPHLVREISNTVLNGEDSRSAPGWGAA